MIILFSTVIFKSNTLLSSFSGGQRFKPISPFPTFYLISVWGLCGENCRKSAKVWKISQNVEFEIAFITVCYPNLRRLGNSRSLTSNP